MSLLNADSDVVVNIEAPAYPKFRPIPRLNRRVVITEKVNGTNGLIQISRLDLADPTPGTFVVGDDDRAYNVSAGSRNRWLRPEDDNFGFAKWVWENAVALTALGEGKHYGEWFGKGIQSGYGLDEKRFALFNTARWYDPRGAEYASETYLERFPKAQQVPEIDALTVVPVIAVTDGRDLNYTVDVSLHILESVGSFIAPGFKDPEGVVVWHDAAGVFFKATIKHDEAPKSTVATK